MASPSIHEYLDGRSSQDVSAAFLSYLANLSCVAEVSPETAEVIVQELADQRSSLKLIASENYCSIATQCAMGNLLTDKYAEGFAYKRFYAGCENVDRIEDRACKLACDLFGADHAYVQPHSGADANMVAFWSILTSRIELPALAERGLQQKDLLELDHADWDQLRRLLGNQKLLAMDLYAGGHLTHGYRYNVSAKMFDAYSYGVSRADGLLDYDEIQRQAEDIRPLILLAGFSAYPRNINYRRMREIADRVGAVLMVDMAHFAGLVAGKVLTGDYDPVPFSHVVTSTTHKTLRGPRGGLVLSTAEFAEQLDRGCPLILGGPLPQMIAAKAVAFTEASEPAFQQYAQDIVSNAGALCEACLEQHLEVVSGGSENHQVILNVTPQGLTGRQAESAVRECGVTLNRNTIPFDSNGPWYASGLRLGTAAVTTLGMKATDMQEIAAIMHLILSNTTPATTKSGTPSKARYAIDANAKQEAQARVGQLLSNFPVYPELDLSLLQRHFCVREVAEPVHPT